MPNGEDTRDHPNRRVDNVVYANFGHPMQNHPAFLSSIGMLDDARDTDTSKEDKE
jgi:adenine C2-methylase RlmN of 23S rRNA A2503 and tRNA A37